MLRIGVTGLMASGKSDVARRFVEHGARLVEGDALGWEVLREPEVRDRLVALFGSSVRGTDGEIDRRTLGRIVFGDAAEMSRLNAIVQPRLVPRVHGALNEPGTDVVVLDAALLSTWSLVPEMDGVVEVTAPVETRVARLAASKEFPQAEARVRVEGQRLPPVRGARRHWKIENAGSREELLARADDIWNEILRMGAGG